MTRDEQRQAWRTYAAALLAGDDVDLQAVVKAADWMVKEERQRFDTPDHSADANKMVERPWVGLTDAERSSIAELYQSAPSTCGLYELLLRVEAQLKIKNGGAR
jgi:hypothetical protein